MKHLIVKEITNENPIKKWSHELMNEHYEEALESIGRENVNQETVFYIELEGKKFMIFYIEGEMKPADLTMEVNIRHREILDSISVKNSTAELLYDLQV